MANLQWLVVGGAPRSGTTALGEALNQSAEIALFHEYLPHRFFAAIESFFVEEDRMRGFPDFNDFSSLMPTRARNAERIARFMFRDVFKKQTRYVGTKMPGYQAWPQPVYPGWIAPRFVHITRNPYDVVLSAIKKNTSGNDSAKAIREGEDALYWWLHAWNFAVAHADNANFHHIFYDDLLTRPEHERARLTEFLGVSDFSLMAFKNSQSAPAPERFKAAGLESLLPLIAAVMPYHNWRFWADTQFTNRQVLGYPLPRGDVELDLTNASLDSRRYGHGFYPAEGQGSWTRGSDSSLLFSVTEEHHCSLQLTFDVRWQATLRSEPRQVEVRWNGKRVFDGSIGLAERNGQTHTYCVYVPDAACRPQETISLQLCVKDPVNPAQGGVNADDRDLGLMIGAVRFYWKDEQWDDVSS